MNSRPLEKRPENPYFKLQTRQMLMTVAVH